MGAHGDTPIQERLSLQGGLCGRPGRDESPGGMEVACPDAPISLLSDLGGLVWVRPRLQMEVLVGCSAVSCRPVTVEPRCRGTRHWAWLGLGYPTRLRRGRRGAGFW